MCNFSPQISKTFFLFIKYSQRHLFHYLVLKRKLYKKKGIGDTVTIFLKSVILNYSNERSVYIGFTHVKILPGQAAVFVSFFGKKRAFSLLLEKYANSEIICPMRLLTVSPW